VALAGVLFAFAANALSPRGLRLSRNFFAPGSSATNRSAATHPLSASGHRSSATNGAVAERLAAEGLRVATSNEVAQLYVDPRREQNLVVFVDARSEQDYRAGHIPGAYSLDYFHAENYLPEIIPICQVAQVVVIYCNGGDCDASELTAQLLGSMVPKDRLVVYGGGMSEWLQQHQPVELGGRGSGQLKP